MKLFDRKPRKPLPYYVRWYESTAAYPILLKNRNFADPETRDKFARKLQKKPGFIKYA